MPLDAAAGSRAWMRAGFAAGFSSAGLIVSGTVAPAASLGPSGGTATTCKLQYSSNCFPSPS